MFAPSIEGSEAQDIFEAAGISLICCSTDATERKWCAEHGEQLLRSHARRGEPDGPMMYQLYPEDMMYGPTGRVAGLRCYIQMILGDEVQIPEDLL